MSPKLCNWMRPDDLVLYQLELLPWSAYTLLIEQFFKQSGYRLRLVRSEPGQTEYVLVDTQGARQLLYCCSAVAAGRTQSLTRLRCSMNSFHVGSGIMATPDQFSAAVIHAGREQGFDFFSGNRLRAKIEQLSVEQRYAVLDSIKAKPDVGL